MAGVKGMKHRRPRTAKERSVYAAARIEQLLDQAREGEIELSPTRLKAMELAYSRLKPTLSAIEQTVVDPRDQQDPAEIQAKLKSLYASNPELFGFLSKENAVAPAQIPVTDSTDQRVTH